MREFLVNNVSDDPHKFYCIPCGKNFPCEKQESGDVAHHCSSTKVDRFTTKMLELKLLALKFRSLRTLRFRKKMLVSFTH